MLKLRNISKYYYSSSKIALGLRKIDLELNIGEFAIITGESGSGKSTLLNVLSGLDTYELGEMYINDEDISHYTVVELENYRREFVGFVFQNYNIIESYTVFQNVEMALIIQGYNPEIRKQRVIELIAKVGLTERIDYKASKLSGGEKQRVVIARALAKDSKILVCDEPTGNLDTKATDNIFKLLSEISENKLVIVVTHNNQAAEVYATRKIRLYDGEIVEDKILKKTSKKEPKSEIARSYKPSFKDILKISINNILSVPKKTLFTMLVTFFIIGSFVFSYGSNLKQRNTSTVFETPFFSNAHPSRLVVTKYDSFPFTSLELEELLTVEHVREVIDYDAILDTTLKSKYHYEEYDYDVYVEFKVLPSSSVDLFDILEGRLPQNKFEVVIAENEYYEVGDTINLSNSIHVKERVLDDTIDYEYKVVGVINRNNSIHDETENLYFTKEAILEFKYDALVTHNQMYIHLDDTFRYVVYQEIRIDNTLSDFEVLGYDAMFFDMCRDSQVETCDVDAFLLEHDLAFEGLSRFENSSELIDVSFTSVPFVEDAYGQAIYMNELTYKALLEEDGYQPSVVVYDMFEAKQVKDSLEDMGYNVFYPNGVVTIEGGLIILLKNIQLFLTLSFSLVVVYFVG